MRGKMQRVDGACSLAQKRSAAKRTRWVGVIIMLWSMAGGGLPALHAKPIIEYDPAAGLPFAETNEPASSNGLMPKGMFTVSAVGSPSSVVSSGLVSYTVTVNAGTTQTSFALIGNFTTSGAASGSLDPVMQTPIGLVNGIPDGTWQCSGSAMTFSCQPNSSAGIGMLMAGTSYEFTVIGRVGSTMLPDSIDLDFPCCGATVTTSILASPPGNLSVSGAANPPRPDPGSSFDFVTSVSNGSSAGPTQPFALTVTSNQVALGGPSNPSFWSCATISNGRICSYVGPPLGPGATVDLILPATAPTGGVLVQALAGIAVSTPDTVVGANPITIFAPTAASIPVTVSPPPSPTPVGQALMYSLTLTNTDSASPNDGATAQNVSLSLVGGDDQGSGTGSFGSGTGTNWSCPPVISKGRGKGAADFSVICDYTLPLGLNQTTTPLNVIVNGPTVAANYTLTANPNADNIFFTTGDEATTVTILAAAADLALTKSASSANVVPGDSVSFGLSITNNGPSPVSGFTLNDQLPAEFGYLGFNGAQFSCFEGNGLVNCTFTGIGLAVGATTSLTIDAQALAVGTAVNSATVNEDTAAPDPDMSNNTDTATVVISATPLTADLQAAASASAATIQPGGAFSFATSVQNLGPGPADQVRLSAQLPTEAILNSLSGSRWTCAQFNQSMSCDLDTPLAAGDSAPLTLNLTALPDASSLSLSVNTSSRTSDPQPNNNSATASLRVQGGGTVDLAIVKSSLPVAVGVDSIFQYQFHVTNRGSATAVGVRITDSLPAGVQFVAATNVNWSCSATGSDLSCDLLGDLGPNEVAILNVDVQAPSVAGTITNAASVASQAVDANSQDNSDQVDTVVSATAMPSADLAVIKTVDNTDVPPGGSINYEIQVTNMGPDAALEVSLMDNLPQGFTFASLSAPGWNCSMQGSLIDCTAVSPLPVASSLAIQVGGTVSATGGEIVNEVFVDSIIPDPNGSNNISRATSRVLATEGPVNLVLQADDSADPVQAGDIFDYLITVENLGTGRAFEILLTDMLPAGVEVVSIAAGVFVCGSSPGQVDCRFDGPLRPSEPQEISITVRAPNEAVTLVNTVRVEFLGDDLDPSDNQVTVETEVQTTPNQDDLEDDLRDALGDINDPVVRDNIKPISNLCSDPMSPVPELCQAIVDALDDGRGDEVANAIRQVVGQQTITQHTSLVEASFAQFNNIDARFRQNRGGGGGGFSVAGLNIRYGNANLPLAFLQAADDEPTEIASEGLVKPWGFFVNGSISGGDKDATQREVAFDFDTYGITAGVDYRLSTRMVLGAAIGYADFDSDYADGGALQTDGLSYHFYGSWYPTDRFFLDGRLSYGDFDFEQARTVRFDIGSLSFDDIALSATEADQVTGALAFGYHFYRAGWSITPSASFSYLDATIDAFVENGSSLALSYAEQDVESIVTSASLSVSKVWSLSHSVITPQLDLAYHYESQNDDQDFSSRIIGASAGSAFFIGADAPDTDYGSAGLGLVWVGANGRQAYLSYRNILGISGFSRWTVNAGFRFEF